MLLSKKKLSWGVVIAAFFLPVATSYNFVDYSIVVFCIDVINERFLSAIWANTFPVFGVVFL